MPLVLFEIKDATACITLNRPEKLNAFNRDMALLLQNILDQCEGDEHIRCVYISGTGKAFSAGQDLAEVTGKEGPGMKNILKEQYNPVVTKIRTLSKPVMAAVNGIAAGAGANIALCCDIIVASESAAFIQAFSKIGLIPDSGGTYFLPRLIGWQKASALMMTGDKINAEEAERMGMIYKVLPDEDFASQSFALAVKLSQMPTQALALTKQALNQSFINDYQQQLQLEDRLQQQAAQTKDYQEGITAFIEKRIPVFRNK
jgi:2-(1,2-epoxy-1,2-dihydrophenyl)acetyl-CoA isomerase